MTDLEFSESRYAAVLKVMEGDRKRFNILEKEYKQLQSEYNCLKITHLTFLEENAEDRVKDAKRVVKIKEDYNKLLHERENQGWNELD